MGMLDEVNNQSDIKRNYDKTNLETFGKLDTPQLMSDPKTGTFDSLENNIQETDPSGKSAHDAGAKLDSGKIIMGSILLQFAQALEEVAEVGTYGANKYSLNGWKSVNEGERRYTDAMLRHLFKEQTEGLIDSELPVKHAAQVAWNALARLHFIIESEKT